MICNKCQRIYPNNTEKCPYCEADNSTLQSNVEQNEQIQQLNNDLRYQYQQPQYDPRYQYQQQYPPYYLSPADMPGRGQAIASMVLGIISLIIPYLNLVTSIIAICLGFSAKNKGYRGGMATAGIACGWVALGLMLLVIVFVIMFASLLTFR